MPKTMNPAGDGIDEDGVTTIVLMPEDELGTEPVGSGPLVEGTIGANDVSAGGGVFSRSMSSPARSPIEIGPFSNFTGVLPGAPVQPSFPPVIGRTEGRSGTSE